MAFDPQILIDALDRIQMTHDNEGSWLVAEQALENSGAEFKDGKWTVPVAPQPEFDCPGCIAPDHANHNSSCKRKVVA